jgi:UDP-2,3-diacylglucosamine pyrophosphatase LpxH
MKTKLSLNDKIAGRSIRCNRQALKTKKGDNFTEVVFLGDCHYGSPQFDQPRFLRMLDYLKKNEVYTFLMGDLIEVATRHSVGAGVYEQEAPTESQHEQMVEWLRPLAEKGLILGSHRGN